MGRGWSAGGILRTQICGINLSGGAILECGGFVMSEKIYLKIDQQRYVKKPKVTIGDVMTVYCSDKDMIEKSDI